MGNCCQPFDKNFDEKSNEKSNEKSDRLEKRDLEVSAFIEAMRLFKEECDKLPDPTDY